MQSILLRGAKQLLTLRGKVGVRRGPEFDDLGVIEEGSVLIENGFISAVGPTRRLENLISARKALQIPAYNCVVMPGFIDPALTISLDRPGAAGRRKSIDFQNESLVLLRSCLQHGTLNAGIKTCGRVGSLGSDLSLLRQVARMGNSPVGLTRIWQPEFDDAYSIDSNPLTDAFHTVCKQSLASAVGVTNGPGGAYNAGLLSAANRAAVPLSLNWKGGGCGDLRKALEVTNASTVFCDHRFSTEEVSTLAASEATAVVKVGDCLLDHEPDGAIQKLIAAGGAVALGSGYDAQLEPNFNMQLVLALAVRRLQLTIEQAIAATTINAAHALGCGSRIGSLEPGKRAEIIVLSLSDYREIPRHLGTNHVAMVIRDGNLVVNRTGWKVGAA